MLRERRPRRLAARTKAFALKLQNAAMQIRFREQQPLPGGQIVYSGWRRHAASFLNSATVAAKGFGPCTTRRRIT